MNNTLKHLTLLGCLLAASGCTTKFEYLGDASKPYYKVGKPYNVYGQWYYPKEDPNYVEEGMASWYGPGFHGKKTANGDRFNANDLTAAHRTLPMPSMVRVTNLENGRSTVLKVNDRGPFSKARIIDVSERAAELLGFKHHGTQKVRVQFLPRETDIMLASLGMERPSSAAPLLQANEAPTVAISTLEPSNIPQPIQKSTLAPVAVAKPATQEFSLIPEAHAGELPAATKTQYEPMSQPMVVLPATLPEQTFFVQLGAFGIKQNAEHVASKTAQLGQSQLTPITVNGKTLYRVQLGPFTSQDAAEKAKSEAWNLGIADARVSQ